MGILEEGKHPAHGGHSIKKQWQGAKFQKSFTFVQHKTRIKQKGRTAMQHDPFSQQQELAQAYQLGSLEEEYVLNPKKILANFGLILVFALFAPLFLLGSSHGTTNVIPIFIFSFTFFFVVGGGVMLAFYYAYRRLHMYVYSNGFLYLKGNSSRVVYWQQIKKVSTNRGYLNVTLYHDGWVSIPSYVGRFGELRARIQQKIVPPRYSS